MLIYLNILYPSTLCGPNLLSWCFIDRVTCGAHRQKKARLAENASDKISRQPGSHELVHKQILPLENSKWKFKKEQDTPLKETRHSTGWSSMSGFPLGTPVSFTNNVVVNRCKQTYIIFCQIFLLHILVSASVMCCHIDMMPFHTNASLFSQAWD